MGPSASNSYQIRKIAALIDHLMGVFKLEFCGAAENISSEINQ